MTGIVLVILAGSFLTLLLSASLFQEARREIASRVLSSELSAEVQVGGDVRLLPGRRIRVELTDIRLIDLVPSLQRRMHLDQASFDFKAERLLDTGFEIENLRVSGFRADFDRNTVEEESEPSDVVALILGTEDDPGAGLLAYFRHREVVLERLAVRYVDNVTGFRFDHNLDSFILAQPSADAPGRLLSEGSVNGKPFRLEGSFSPDHPFRSDMRLGKADIALEGLTTSSGEEYDGTLTLRTASLGDTLDATLLDGEFDGTAQLSASLFLAPGSLRLQDIDLAVQLDTGTNVTASGEVGDLLSLDAVDILADISLPATRGVTERVRYIDDLRFLGASALILGTDGDLRLDEVNLHTNAMDANFERIGPISVGSLHRQEDGALAVSEVDVKVGPPESPVASATGTIGNVLTASGIAFDGQIHIPGGYLVSFKPLDELGIFRGQFSASDAGGGFGIDTLSGEIAGNPIWSLSASLQAPDLKDLASLSADLSVDWKDLRAFQSKVGTAVIGVRDLQADLAIQGGERALSVESSFGVDGRSVDLSVEFGLDMEAPSLRGRLASPEVSLEDLNRVAEAILAIVDPKTAIVKESRSGRSPKPLVLEEPRRIVKPLVIDPDAPVESVFDWEDILRNADVDLGIRIGRLVGQQSVAALDSALSLQGGVLRLFPVRADFGPVAVDLSAWMDVVSAPDRLRLQGNMRGVDIGRLMRASGVDFPASGTVSGAFDLTTDLEEPSDLLLTARGAARLKLDTGQLGTSLLELAGRGVLPWLFSRDLARGGSRITCAVAPLGLERGILSIRDGVLETPTVQLVVTGAVDLRRESLELRGEPRSVGQPFERSPYPFAVTGPFAAPDVALQNALAPRGGPIRVKPHPNRKPCVPDRRQFRLARPR
ncbi:AsmA-like protein [Aliiruegeria haliotis]|uniref:AsmA-like protein n=1 Tax=Aliiruegeria haliotis TaxID=1280846 RepID=A0A2T0RPR0_9RHOB|nr:AsmA-like C-terminal region-containing protein [Aliiruegeria haliotis]PRY23176.1 AsmA-like protein [Aliiruegeria haliotis]